MLVIGGVSDYTKHQKTATVQAIVIHAIVHLTHIPVTAAHTLIHATARHISTLATVQPHIVVVTVVHAMETTAAHMGVPQIAVLHTPRFVQHMDARHTAVRLEHMELLDNHV